MPVDRPPKVLLIGWDAADWRVIRPLLQRGEMPYLHRLMAAGAHGPIQTLAPILSPMLWTSIATGKRAWKHGIHGFSEPMPNLQGVRPISVLSRKAKAFWNILNQNGHRCNVVGWWPSHPAEPLDGAMISNHYPVADVAPGQSWLVKAGMVHPERLATHLEKLRLHPAELGQEHLLPFIPRAAEVDQEKDSRLHGLAKILSEAVNIHAAATGLLQNEPCDMMAVYFDAIDHFSHGFMRYHPPRLPDVRERDFEIYSGVIEGAYKFHDMMLGTLLNQVGGDCAVLLRSDHGFHPDTLRPSSLPNEPAGPAAEHAPYRIFVLRAPGVAAGRRVHGATLLDIAPTVLHLFGLPAGRDMDGRVLAELFESPPKLRTIESWETIQGPHPDGQHPSDAGPEIQDNPGVLNQLVALGYIEPPPEDAREAAQKARDELNYNLALAYLDGGLAREALALFQPLWERHAMTHRFGVGVVRCWLLMERPEKAREAFETVKQRKRDDALVASAELRKWEEAWKAGDTESAPGDQELRSLRQLRARAETNFANLQQIEARLLHAEGSSREALNLLAKLSGQNVAVRLLSGDLLLCLKDYEAAAVVFSGVLQETPENPEALLGLARSHLWRKRDFEAAGYALSVTELAPHFPAAHYTLGVALHRLGRIEMAENAFRMTVMQAPGHVEAHRRLALLYTGRLKNPELAATHRAAATEARRRVRELRAERGLVPHPQFAESAEDVVLLPARPAPKGLGLRPGEPQWKPEEVVTIVSGLPRSGTSLVMQMLAAGGFPLLSDGRREADENNPRGYFEYELVKGLRRDASWIAEARGRGIKIIAHLLSFLPKDQHYRIIFVERNLEEILDSQEAMLKQLQKPAQTSRKLLRTTYLHQLAAITEWLEAQTHIDVLYLSHADVLHHPQNEAGRINGFLGGQLDIKAMTVAVEPSLHRQRSEGSMGRGCSP